MFDSMRDPLDDDLLDHQTLDGLPISLNRARQKLSYWVRFVCSIALLISGLGVAFFSYIFVIEGLELRYVPYKEFWIIGGSLWGLLFVLAATFARAGKVYAKISLAALIVLGIGAVWVYCYSNWHRMYSITNIRFEEFVLVVGMYLAGLLAFPAAFFGWKYAQALRVPQLEEDDWEWKAKTTQLGLKAWRLGALAFIVLGIAFTPPIIKELEYYSRRLNYDPIVYPVTEDAVEEAMEAVEEAPDIERF